MRSLQENRWDSIIYIYDQNCRVVPHSGVWPRSKTLFSIKEIIVENILNCKSFEWIIVATMKHKIYFFLVGKSSCI